MALLLVAFATIAFADDAFVVRGAIHDATSSPIPGCTVTLKKGKFERINVSNANGEYAFSTVLPGDYDLTVTLEGFDTSKQKVHVAGETVVETMLSFGPLSVATIVNCRPARPEITDARELASLANDVLRFAYVDDEPTVAYVQWCERNGLALEVHRGRGLEALRILAEGSSKREWLERALETNDATIISVVQKPQP